MEGIGQHGGRVTNSLDVIHMRDKPKNLKVVSGFSSASATRTQLHAFSTPTDQTLIPPLTSRSYTAWVPIQNHTITSSCSTASALFRAFYAQIRTPRVKTRRAYQQRENGIRGAPQSLSTWNQSRSRLQDAGPGVEFLDVTGIGGARSAHCQERHKPRAAISADGFFEGVRIHPMASIDWKQVQHIVADAGDIHSFPDAATSSHRGGNPAQN